MWSLNALSLLLTFFGNATSDRLKVISPTSPKFNRIRVTESLNHKRKIKVGFLDVGDLKRSELSQKVKLNYLKPYDNEDESKHSVMVINAFLNTLTIPLDQIEITYCQSEAKSNWGICLDDLSKMDLINVSMTNHKLSDYELKKFKEFSQKGLVVFSAAGNKGNSFPLFPCALDLPNKVCVGGIEDDGKIDSESNSGSFVNVYDDFWTLHNDEYRFGTSFAAPKHMARFLNSLEPGKGFDYEKSNQRFIANQNL